MDGGDGNTPNVELGLTGDSGGFLQSNQSAVRIDYRVLLADHVSGDEGYRRVRVSLARFGEVQKAHQDASARVHRAPNGLGTGLHQ